MKYHITSIFLFSLLLLMACQEEDQMDKKASIKGYVQKGPFINGTTITIAELDKSFVTTGKNFSTSITDNKGGFSIGNINLSSNCVQLTATGFYFDEVKGENSAAPLTLHALTDISEVSQVNINVISHLEKDRVLHLVGQGQSFSEAKKQAQREVLAIFGIEKEDVAPSEAMDIVQQGDHHAVLLAISATLQGQNTVAELSELLANIITDMREDGKLDSENLKEQIRAGATYVRPENIKSHLIQRYHDLGIEVTLPDFEKYLDSDGDGVLNSNDDEMPESFAFTPITNAKRDTSYTSETITLKGLPYPTTHWLSAGEYQATLIVNGAEVSNGTMLSEGDKVAIKLQTSPDYSTTSTAEFTVGEFTTTWTVTTTPDPWKGETSYPGLADFYHALAEVDGKIYMGLGVSYHGSLHKEFYEYNTTSIHWSKKADFPGTGRWSPLTFSSGKNIYVGLGEDESFKSLHDFWEYNIETDQWTQLKDFPVHYSNMQKRMHFTVDLTTYGIFTYKENDTVKTELWQFSHEEKQWNKINTIDQNVEDYQYLFSINGKAYFKLDTEQKLVAFEPETQVWTILGSLPNIDVAASLGSKGYAYHDDSIYEYESSADTWNLVETIDNNLVNFRYLIPTGESIYFITETSSIAKNRFSRFTP